MLDIAIDIPGGYTKTVGQVFYCPGTLVKHFGDLYKPCGCVSIERHKILLIVLVKSSRSFPAVIDLQSRRYPTFENPSSTFYWFVTRAGLEPAKRFRTLTRSLGTKAIPRLLTRIGLYSFYCFSTLRQYYRHHARNAFIFPAISCVYQFRHLAKRKDRGTLFKLIFPTCF